MVFTADGAVLFHPRRALLLRNDGWRSQFEARALSAWFAEHGIETESLPPHYRLDGGNLLQLSPGSYLIGLKPGSSGKAESYLARLLRLVCGAQVHPLALRQKRFLHLDMVVGNLGGRALLVYWDGLHPVSRPHLLRWASMPIISVDEPDALRFACNCICLSGTVVTGPISRKLKTQIEALGLKVIRLNLSEFYKAGGGAKCLTLPLN